jgi:sugar lactone lactonase YvrE
MPHSSDATAFTLRLEDLRFVGSGLQRPECVLCTRSGSLYVSDRRGGVTHIAPDGRQTLFARRADQPNPTILPNGFALQEDGSFLIADMAGEGGVWKLTRDGTLRPFLQEVDGVPMTICNYVGIDPQKRIWVSISSRQTRRELAYRQGLDDGFVVLVDGKGARIVAEGLGFTNEVVPHPSGKWVYINETFSRRLTRFRLHPDGSLSGRETVAAFGEGTFPDGLTFDAEGGVWITGPLSNRILRVDPDGNQHLVLEDFDPEFLATTEKAFQAGQLGRPHLDNPRSKLLKGLTSLAFGGPDLRTAYVGCLLGDALVSFTSPVPGAPMTHWGYP